jgi:DNA-damage-inducible protein J
MKELNYMAAVSVFFEMEEDLLSGMKRICAEMGMDVKTAFSIFAAKVTRKRRIPFKVTADPDPFYSDANVRRLRESIAQLEAGRGTIHELIGVRGLSKKTA